MGSGAPTAGAEIQEKMVRENREGGRRRKAAGEGEGLDREGRGGGKVKGKGAGGSAGGEGAGGSRRWEWVERSTVSLETHG